MKYWLAVFLAVAASWPAAGQVKNDSFAVLFPLNGANLTAAAATAIDKLVFGNKLLHGQPLIILGYADYLGSDKYNEALSAVRAKHVKDYLTTLGFAAKDIMLCTGKGKIERAAKDADGFAPDRKVQIIVDRQPPPPPRPAPVAPKPVPHANEVLDISKLQTNDKVALRNISFFPGSPEILPSSLPELENLYHFMAANASVAISIEGHVCCLGDIEGVDDPYSGEGTLSELRAKAIYDYLTGKGIDAGRLAWKGLGNRNPVVRREVTEEDRVLNRRVEIRITAK